VPFRARLRGFEGLVSGQERSLVPDLPDFEIRPEHDASGFYDCSGIKPSIHFM
jgi:hypothetical protein